MKSSNLLLLVVLVFFQMTTMSFALIEEEPSRIAFSEEEFCLVESDNLSFILPVEDFEDDLEQDTEEGNELTWIVNVDFDDHPSIESIHYSKFIFIAYEKLELAFSFSSYSEKYFTPPDFV